MSKEHHAVGVSCVPLYGKDSSAISIPIKFASELKMTEENEFTLNHQREHIDKSHKIEKVSISVSYGGRLPVGRER